MSRAYVVVEGATDADILRRVLPRDLVEDVEFVVANGRSAAMSLARSILVVKRAPVALVVDADTNDEVAVKEQLDLLRYYMSYGAGAAPFEVLAAVPEIDAVLFQDRSLIERITGRKSSDLEWQMARRHPKEWLTAVMPDRAAVAHHLNGVGEDTLSVLRQHALVRQLMQFLSSVSVDAGR